MSYELLGESFDIHGGGNDLMFPHHENEIAQSCCAHPEGGFASVWMHNEMLQVEGRKMSKSLGNFFTVRDLLDQGVPGEVIRFVFLSTHYRKPMDWTAEKAESAKKLLKRWAAFIENEGSVSPLVIAALANDLNTPQAIAELHRLDALEEYGSLGASLRFIGFQLDASEIFELPTEWGIGSAWDGLIQELVTQRNRARLEKDFQEADRIRDGLGRAGVKLLDDADGTKWELTDNFEAAKLKDLE